MFFEVDNIYSYQKYENPFILIKRLKIHLFMIIYKYLRYRTLKQIVKSMKRSHTYYDIAKVSK